MYRSPVRLHFVPELSDHLFVFRAVPPPFFSKALERFSASGTVKKR